MSRIKITVRLTPAIAAALGARAAATARGISNCIESLICQALRRKGPAPNRPHPLDGRYTRRPRPRQNGG